MAGLKIFIVPWLCFILLSVVKGQYCPTEKDEQLGSLMTWYTAEAKEVVSHPPCINERYELSKRRCNEKGLWIPSEPPYCKLVQHTFIPKCPYDFITKNNFCIHISEPRKWTEKCPFPNDLIITKPEHLKILHSMNISEFWLPVKRNQPFGRFVWFHPTKFYNKYKHSYLNKAVKTEEGIFDCIIITSIKDKSNGNNSDVTYETKIVSCDNSFKQVCIYSTKASFFPTTNLVTCFDSKKNLCYALSHSSKYQSRDAFCKTLASPTTQLENYIIKTLVKENTCWIGLKRNEIQTFQWENTRRYPEFTDWKINANFEKHLVAITQDGWELYNGFSLNCGVCQVDINTIEINLRLKPNYKLGLLILTVYSPKYFINEGDISCSAVGINDVNLSFAFDKIHINEHMSDKILSQFSEKDDRTIYFLRPNTKFYNYYTCKGIILPKGEEITSEKVLFGTDDSSNEYAVHMIIRGFCSQPKKCDPVYNDDLQEVIDDMHSDLFQFIRPMKIISTEYKNLEMIIHIHVKKDRFNRTDEYFAVQYKLIEIFNKRSKMQLISFKSCLGCLEHMSLNRNVVLSWDFAEIGSTIMPQELCLNSSGLPVTKSCVGDFISGADWSKESGDCSLNYEVSNITKHLHDFYLYFLDFSADDIVNNLTSLTKESYNLLPSDIYYVSQILKASNFTNHSNSTLLVDNIVSILNNLIAIGGETLKLSNELLNSTNILLDVFEKLMEEFEDLDLDDDGIFQVITPFLFYQVSDVSQSNVTGVVMQGPNDKNSFLDYNFKPLKSDTNMNELLKTQNLDTATFIPEEIIENIRNETNATNIRVYISIFYNNSLFIEEEKQDKQPVSKIVSVSIMGYNNYLSSPIPVIFRNTQKSKPNLSCSYWSFGLSTYEEKYPNRWAHDGGIYWNMSIEDVEVCAFSHLTHFALLLGEPSSFSFTMAEEIAEYHDNNLSIITAVGCSLSVIGITGILITTILFKSWREKTGTKVLLNLSASVLLEMFVIFLADTKHVPSNETSCIILGCILHYSTISSFCWMLVVAYLQYLRFVKVFGAVTPHLVLKSCIVGWILPFIPVVSLLIWDPNSYNPMAHLKTSGLCYPHGATTYSTVILPISIILVINIAIFCIVLYNVTHKTVSSKSNSSTLKYNQLKLAILLFFLLGLTWIFGFLTVFKDCIVCLYLFCSTATTQGFVLFIFYVVLDSNTRKLWLSVLKPRLSISRKKLSSRLSSSSATQDFPANTNSTVNIHN